MPGENEEPAGWVTGETPNLELDSRVIELIADRVAVVLRDQLEEIAAALASTTVSERPLTVEDVAERFGVARSTVYAHWREWGGYKLGDGEKATIRFQPAFLPEHPSNREPPRGTPKLRPARRRGRPVLRGEPRLPTDLEVGG